MIATRTITINAAFLQEIKDDNREVARLLELLHDRFCQTYEGYADTRNIVDSLVRLRDQMAIHFTLEEAFGYFEDAVDVAPRLSERAESLRAQHDIFFCDLCDMVEQAERLLYHEASLRGLSRLAQEFSDFYDGFLIHEAKERELIMEAFDDDVGVGD